MVWFFGHSLGQFWVHWSGFEFLWNVNFKVFGLIWFMRWDGLDFWKLMRLGNFCMVQSTQKRHGTIFLYALDKRNFD